MTQDECLLEQYMHKMSEVLRCPYTVQAARPARHWWLCPRGLAWFQVLMVWSLVKPPASGGPLSRIGDYLFAARGPGLFLRIRKRTTFPPKSAVTRGPPHPLFHRRARDQGPADWRAAQAFHRPLRQGDSGRVRGYGDADGHTWGGGQRGRIPHFW